MTANGSPVNLCLLTRIQTLEIAYGHAGTARKGAVAHNQSSA